MTSVQHTPEWYDAQYNNRARIPEHMQILQSWAEQSRHARNDETCVKDIAYQAPAAALLEAGQDPGHTLDLFVPKVTNHAPTPVLVYLHGGYWRALSKRDQSFIGPVFARCGALVAIPDYPLAPAVTLEELVMQVANAVAWTWRHAKEYVAKPGRIIVAGHSAGGHLAAMMLRLEWHRYQADLPDGLVQGALSLSGLFDLEPLRHTPFLAPDLRLDARSALKLSPACMPAPKGKLVALVGAQESEEFLRQNRLIQDAWGKHVVSVCESIPGRHHLSVVHDLIDRHSRAHQLTLDLLGLPPP